MAEARISPDQLKSAVDASVARAISREGLQGGGVIKGPILLGIIAWPDGTQVSFKDVAEIQDAPSAG